MQVPLLDLIRQYKSIKEEIDEAIQRVLNSQYFILGDEVENFENEVADYCGTEYAVGVASGTDALLLSLRAAGVGEGKNDKVITTPFTFFATAGAIHNVGAKPVFVDIDPETFNLDPAQVRRILESSPSNSTNPTNPTNSISPSDVKAIIPVHLYGQPADMDEIMKIGDEYGLYVIEDAAQAIGATYLPRAIAGDETTSRGRKLENYEPGPLTRKAGTIGDLGCFSFFPSKNLGGYGDGGMVITDNDALAERVRLLHVHGSTSEYHHHVIGTNSRLDSLQAAILRAKLPYLDRWSEARRKNAEYYNEGLGNIEEIATPIVADGRKHIYHQYTIRVRNGKRDEVRAFLEKKGIGTKVYYPLPLHLQACFEYLGYKEGDLPEAERAASEVLSLPVFPELTGEEKKTVVRLIKGFLGNGNKQQAS